MVTVLYQGKRKARKHHTCYECYRAIAPNETYGYQNNVYDGSVYTIKWHIDCSEMGSEYRKEYSYYDDEFPPLRDDMVESDEYRDLCNLWRGKYPHVIARMELTDQLMSIQNDR